MERAGEAGAEETEDDDSIPGLSMALGGGSTSEWYSKSNLAPCDKYVNAAARNSSSTSTPAPKTPRQSGAL